MTDAADPSSDSSPSLLRRIAVWGGGILGGLFVLLLVAALLIPQFFTSEELKGYVIPPMEEATGRQVEIDEIGLRVLWTPAVSVSGFRLANREGYGPEPGVEAKELNVEVALWPLLTGAIEPSAVELVDPVIRYEIAEDGKSTNIDDLMASDTTQAEAEEGSPLPIPVSNFRTTGAQVRYLDRSTGQSVELDFDAQLSALPDGNALTSEGTIDVQALRAVLPDVREDTLSVTNATITYDVRAALSDGRIDLSDLTIETAPITLGMTGSVTRLNTRPVVDLIVETREADLAQLAAFAPAAAVEGLNPQGTLQLKTTIQGPLPDSTGAMDSLSVDGTGRLSGIGVDYQGAALLRDFSADLALSLQEAAVRSMKGRLFGADLSGNVAVADPMGTPQVDLDLETGAMNLADLAAFAPPEQVEGYNPQGTLQLALTANGPIPEGTEDMDQLTVDGTGQLASVGVDYDGTAMLRDLGADLSFSSTTAAVQGLKGQLLGKPLEGRVTINDPLGSPTVDGQLAGAADIGELAALAGDDAGMEGLRGTADYDVTFAGPVDNPDAIRPNGRIRLTKFRYPYEGFRHPVEIPDATVQLTGTGLSMNRFTIQTGEQSMALQTTVRNLFPISKGLAETDPAMAVDFTYTSDRLDLVELYPETTGDTSEVYYSQLFAASLSGSEVNGRSPEAIAKKLYGGVELPAYTVDGNVEIATFLNDPQRVDDLAFDVQMRDRRMEMRNLSGTTYEGQLAGSVTFDQSGSATSAARSGTGESVLLASAGGGAAPMPPSSDLDYDIRLEGARAGAFLEDWTTLGSVVNGTLDLQMDGDTPLTEGFLPVANALTAKGTSIVADGGLSLDLGVTKALVDKLGLGSALTSFKRFGGPFTIEDGALELGTWEMGGASTNAQLSGALGLAGSVDVEMRMDVPLSALQKTKIPGLVGDSGGKLASLVQKLAGGDAGSNTIPIRVQVGGTMSDPTVEVVDKEAVRSKIQSLVKEEGLNRVRNLFDGG